MSHRPKGVKGKDECRRVDLTEAYKRAKPMYNGRLERTFVLLKEEGVDVLVTGSNTEPVGTK